MEMVWAGALILGTMLLGVHLEKRDQATGALRLTSGSEESTSVLVAAGLSAMFFSALTYRVASTVNASASATPARETAAGIKPLAS